MAQHFLDGVPSVGGACDIERRRQRSGPRGDISTLLRRGDADDIWLFQGSQQQVTRLVVLRVARRDQFESRISDEALWWLKQLVRLIARASGVKWIQRD